MRQHLRAAIDVLLGIVQVLSTAKITPVLGAHLGRADGTNVGTGRFPEGAFGDHETCQELRRQLLAFRRFDDPVGKFGCNLVVNAECAGGENTVWPTGT